MDGFERILSLITEAADSFAGAEAHGAGLAFLAAVFAWSGIAKLRRPALAAMAMIDFGLLRHLRPRLGALAGGLELVVAAALASGLAVPAVASLFAPVAAVALWFFTFLLARALRLGRRFACFCFGTSESQLSPWTLLRTVLLASLATGLALGTPSGTGPDLQVAVLQTSAALGVLGAVTLTGAIPRLLRWNRDPFGLADQNWVRR
jgi:hypothetical protein